MVRSFDVTYGSVDMEIIPRALLWGWPASPVRLVLGGHLPFMIMVSSAALYYFVLVLRVFPATSPSTEGARARCRRFRSAHNLCMCLYSAFCCLATAASLYGRGELTSWEGLLCSPVEGTALRPLSVSFTLSKLVEWIDTAFLVWLGRSPPAALHLYHHATTFWLFCFVMNAPGPEKLGLLLNGAVHALMYGHYYAPWPRPLVPAITVLQILQLAAVTYFYTVGPARCPDARWARGGSEHPAAFLTPYAMVPVFLWMFVVFFVKRFLLGTPKNGRKKTE